MTISFPILTNSCFEATIADNSPRDIHKRGANGVASLVIKETGRNLFVPESCGLNYELFELEGLPFFEPPEGSLFEPRWESLTIESADPRSVVMTQAETAYSHISTRIVFRVEEPYYLHQRLELTFHRRFCHENEKNRFSGLCASYIHQPPDPHLYLKADHTSPVLSGWIGLTKAFHRAPELLIHPLPDGREISTSAHLEAMCLEPSLKAPDPFIEIQAASLWGHHLPYYYGLLADDLVFLMMFRRPETFRLAYSPNGGEPEQEIWNPAWDYVLYLEDAQVGQPYTWDLCLALKPYQGRADVLREVERYLASDICH